MVTVPPQDRAQMTHFPSLMNACRTLPAILHVSMVSAATRTSCLMVRVIVTLLASSWVAVLRTNQAWGYFVFMLQLKVPDHPSYRAVANRVIAIG
ncbi:hypothetical protein QL093DRAFT_2325109 [Fusarium oxysporum]|nr:hypothetical protein QL093DRAFT_2325109 [Fusarium oxysporum]